MRTRHATAAVGLAVLLCSAVVPAGTAAAQQVPAPPAITYTVDQSKLPFEALPGTTTRREWGVLDGAGFRIEVPANWNGDLVTYSHGFVSPLKAELETPFPPLREYYVRQGYAWASSSYSRNGYAVAEGVRDTQALVGKFAELVRPAERVYATGVSMGGHVVGAMIEQFPDTYAGALPVCGVMGDEELFDYFLGHAAAAQTLADVEAALPPPPDYLTRVVPAIQERLGYGPGVDLEPAGHQLSAVTEQLSGGERPLFDLAFDYWSDTAATGGLPFLLGVYGGALSGGPATAANDFASNVAQTYQLDDVAAVSPSEQVLNAAVPRRAQTGTAPFPVIRGTLGRDTKVLTMHTIGDLFVPFSMQQVYKREALAQGSADRLVQRAIRDVAHCAFTPQESVRAFADLVAWVENGRKPAGDEVLDPEVLADRDYGCTFTAGEHKGIPACGTAPVLSRASGADRVLTAVDLVSARYRTADTVVLARADAYADALAGAPLAARLDAPVLLVGPDGPTPEVLQEIDRLGASQAYLLGGPRALPDSVVAQLRAVGISRTVRLGGADRYATARLIARELGGTAAFVVQGGSTDASRGWPDAVAVSGLAAFLEQPVLLVEQDRVPAATARAVEELGLREVTVVGGEDAVSAAVVTALDKQVASVDRLAGADRYGTSAAVARASLEVGMQLDQTVIATGTTFADALVAGPVAAAAGSVLLLVDADATTVEPTVALLAAQGDTVGAVLLVGGPAVISPAVEAALRGRLG